MNDVRTRITMKHANIGEMEFAWDDGEWVVICFRPRRTIPYWMTYGYRLDANTAHSVERKLARDMWYEFVRQGWSIIRS